MRHRLLLLYDVAAVLAFVAIGRDAHDDSSALGGILSTALPFLIALVVGWTVTKAWRAPERPRTGGAIAPLTVVLGLFLRNTWFDEGTAVPFMIVTAVFLGATIVGWRLALTQLNRWRSRHAPQASIEPSK